MKVLNCEQASRQWFLARRVRPTGSGLGNIVTPTGKAVSGQKRETYLYELLGERITGQTTEVYVSAAMERGTKLEPEARSWYQMTTGNAVEQVGFIYGLDGRTGCSPDGLIGEDGGLEIKCSTLPVHLKNVLAGGVPATWSVQVQACLWITGRKFWDVCLYTDAVNVPSVVIRAEPDIKVISTLAAEVPAFCDELDALEAKIREQYDIPLPPAIDIEQASGDVVYPF